MPLSPAEFVAKWSKSESSELANSQSFLHELCALLDVPRPDPTTANDAADAYVFERRITFPAGGTGRIDLYRRGRFVLESKQGSERRTAEEEALLPARKKKTGTAVRGTPAWDRAMLKARNQAEDYAKALPASEGWPPFLIVADVGHCLDLYADFTQAGKAHLPFPDPNRSRLRLADLERDETRELLRAIWLDPLGLDPARKSAAATRELADRLAKLSTRLEAAGHPPEAVAAFLMRCLFTMFAEDVEILRTSSARAAAPKAGDDAKPFTALLRKVLDKPENFPPMVENLWQAMDKGGFSPAIEDKVRHFNGGLFADTAALSLNRTQLELLLEAADADWKNVEPAIFGTLLERALDPVERHKLGAHYTPRAYVERLVLPTVIEPLRAEWADVTAAAAKLEDDGDRPAARDLVQGFYQRLLNVRVLDPACGSGNFLYVAMEHMKRLEGEVVALVSRLGGQPDLLGVRPDQFLGIEINPRAREIADLVLWLGYIQWHLRTTKVDLPTPVLHEVSNIECRDAVLAHDGAEPVLDDNGHPVTRWDGRTTKSHPVTGEPVPDDSARVPVLRYKNPRKADWPQADYIIGNPPFIGNKRMRAALGDGYAEAIRAAYPDVSGHVDFVMYWWDRAAELLSAGAIRRFGFITTNSLHQSASRSVLERFVEPSRLHLAYAIPDHPWVDESDGAAVRIAMTVADQGGGSGLLQRVTAERENGEIEHYIEFSSSRGVIHSNLQTGADVTDAVELRANRGLSFMGVTLVGDFRISREELAEMGLSVAGPVRPYVNGKELTQTWQDRLVIDCFGLTEPQLRRDYPRLFQRLLERVKPLRDQNKRAAYRDRWWIFGEPRTGMRSALVGLSRYVVTLETSKHRVFQFLGIDVVPDHTLFVIATDDALHLGVLSSRIHVLWALAGGGRLGVGNDPRYRNQTCFDPFPFPACTPAQQARIRELAEALDAHRKRQQAAHPGLTMTGMYNALGKLRGGGELGRKEKLIHEQGLVSILRELHDQLDAAVAAAYGWPADLLDEQILERLVALNRDRAAEEARGLVRWLRPEFQNPSGPTKTQKPLVPDAHTPPTRKPAAPAPGAKPTKRPWPKPLPDRVRAVRTALAESPAPLTANALASTFKGAQKKTVAELLETLVTLGQARRVADHYAA